MADQCKAHTDTTELNDTVLGSASRDTALLHCRTTLNWIRQKKRAEYISAMGLNNASWKSITALVMCLTGCHKVM